LTERYPISSAVYYGIRNDRKTQNKYSGLNLEDNKRQRGILAYVDDIIMLGSDSQEVKTSPKELIINSKDQIYGII
jgi:hypothetical protein